MDFYQYYLRRMTTRPDKKLAIQSCRDMVMKLFDEGPTSWGIESGAAFLSALHEVKAPGVNLLTIFNAVEEALFVPPQRYAWMLFVPSGPVENMAANRSVGDLLPEQCQRAGLGLRNRCVARNQFGRSGTLPGAVLPA